MDKGEFDFSGWATRNDLLCSDGRTIRRGAFSAQDGARVPLVWNHQHNSVDNILGHAILENRDEGVYAYCKFNDTEVGNKAKEIVKHGDVESLSIYANQLKQSRTGDVYHGVIRELSLVLAGANAGAYIENVMMHSEDGEVEGIEASWGEGNMVIYETPIVHADKEEDQKSEDNEDDDLDMEAVVKEIDSMNERQKKAVYAVVGMALEENSKEENNEKGEEEMKQSAFEMNSGVKRENFLSHSDFQQILKDGKKHGTLRASYENFMETNYLQHDDDPEPDPEPTPVVSPYGIQYPDMLFPEARNMNIPPEFISRNMDWVQTVMAGVHHTPFSRIKNMYADITEDAARAKGYIKGNFKKEEVFSLLKRSTEPTTVYKKQKMDRDDVIDITDFDVLAWIKAEMRVMLNEELARAYLIGDGRLASDEDHIDDTHIRPIMNDADLFVIRWSVSGSGDTRAKNFIRASIKSRKNYRGSGNPIMFTTEDLLTDMLLLEDQIGHKLYKTEQELATALRVRSIVTVPVMEGVQDKDSKDVLAIIVNLNDYNVGADKGGSLAFFEDFDIDYNQQKYLIETRCSGALTKPFSAIVLRAGANTQSDEPSMADAMAPYKDPRLTESNNGEG